MKNFAAIAAVSLVALSLSACASDSGVALRTVSESPVGVGSDKAIIGKAITTSLKARLWTIEEETDDAVIASIRSDGGKFAKIKVSYDEDSFDIERLDTENMDYDEETGLIAPRYNRWITNIEHDVMIRTGIPRAEANAHVYRARAEILAETAADE